MSASAAGRLRPAILFAATAVRQGNDPSECEDRLACAGTRFAVADGASEGSYSHVWARLLVDAFCAADHHGQHAAGEWLAVARGRWRRWAEEASERDLPWFTRDALRHGAFAAFVGIAFPDRTLPAWTAMSCGDACVFLVRGAELVCTFPLSAGSAFTTAPPLVASSPGAAGDRFEYVHGTARPGDRFYLVTDALAHWFLAAHESGGAPWLDLDAVSSRHRFERFVAEERATGALRNDDVALLTIALSA